MVEEYDVVVSRLNAALDVIGSLLGQIRKLEKNNETP